MSKMCTVFTIVNRHDVDMVAPNLDYGFELSEAHTTADDIVLVEPGWTLYSFDFKTAEAIFLDVGADCDLSKAPFSYLAQRTQSHRLARLPFSSFLALADHIKAGPRIVHLFNTGHCGSTLLHHVFNRVEAVWCISEPQFTFDATMKREAATDTEVQLLLSAGLKFLSCCPSAGAADIIVVKHYSQATRQLAVYAAIDPQAKSIFMYRDGESWCESVFRFAQRMGGHFLLDAEERQFVWWIMSGNRPQSELDGIVDMKAHSVRFDDLAAVCWALHLRDVEQSGYGPNILALRYNELNADRAAMIKKLFDWLGLHCDPQETLKAFEADSHEGSRTARTIAADGFKAENFERVRMLLAHPQLNRPSQTLLPHTLLP
jgi:Sulfotransferase domain